MVDMSLLNEELREFRRGIRGRLEAYIRETEESITHYEESSGRAEELKGRLKYLQGVLDAHTNTKERG